VVSYFDTLKYTKQIRQIFAEQFKNPNEEFVKFFGKQVYDGVFTQSIKEQFTELTRRAFHQFVNERFDDRLSAAFGGDRKGDEERRWQLGRPMGVIP